MITMQYNITLPNGYDMGIIRKRVSDSGSKTDGFRDLKMKAYLIAEKAKYNNYENQYAPFYLWEKVDGMNQFLLGGPFNNILNSFGWQQVHNWMVLHAQIKKTSEQQFALIQTMSIPIGSDFAAMSYNEKEKYTNMIADPTIKSYITAYNPLTWELCHFYMTTDLDMLKKISNNSLIYDVHHIS